MRGSHFWLALEYARFLPVGEKVRTRACKIRFIRVIRG
jgi:hypothetical protein